MINMIIRYFMVNTIMFNHDNILRESIDQRRLIKNLNQFNITHIIRTDVSFFNIPKFVISVPKSSFELSD